MSAPASWSDLIGRDRERAEIDELVAGARQGLSGAVVLKGEAGVGKTALMRSTVRAAPDLRHLDLTGIEAESGFPFAGLHRFANAHLGLADDLPGPQRRALDVAFGRSDGPPAEPFMVGLATLSLLGNASVGRPTLVTIDDAHWLDRESLLVLGFAARRLDAEGIVMIFAARQEGMDLSPFDGLAEIEVSGLPPDDAVTLLRAVVASPIDTRVADEVARATDGNPLALHDLGAALTKRQLEGSERLPEPLPVGSRLEAHYLSLVESLPAPTREWLLLASAESSGDLPIAAAAARMLGLDEAAAEPAERAGVVAVRDRIEFRHPLVRAAIYGAATGTDRRRVHRAIAEAVSSDTDPDRRAHHLAAATTGPDDHVADELERAAARAQLRGGYAARAELLARSATLTPDPVTAARRTVDAAEAALGSGAARRATALLESIDPDVLDAGPRARYVLITARAIGMSGELGASAQISRRCLDAAAIARDHDVELARDALANACTGATLAGSLLDGTTVDEIARAVRATPPPPGPVDDNLSEAFATLVLDGFEAAVPVIRSGVARLLDPATPDEVVLRRYLVAVTLSTITLDDRGRWALHERVLRAARDTGALGELGTILYAASMALTIWGRLEEADDLLTEGVQLHTVLARSSREFDIYRHAELAAWRGGARADIEAMLQITVDAGNEMGHGSVVAVAHVARVILELSCGNYDAAADAGEQLLAEEYLCMHTRVLPDLVEAASRAGRDDIAAHSLAVLRERATAAKTPHATALLGRAEAILADDPDAESRYVDAIAYATRTDGRSDLARVQLLFGEWLRRRRRPSEAREHLGAAHDAFTRMGAAGFAERARIELAATGMTARARTPDTARDLTSQERQIAGLAADGLTNAEIASRLFISAPTVDYHLRKVFRKLDIGSRRQLRGRAF